MGGREPDRGRDQEQKRGEPAGVPAAGAVLQGDPADRGGGPHRAVHRVRALRQDVHRGAAGAARPDALPEGDRGGAWVWAPKGVLYAGEEEAWEEQLQLLEAVRRDDAGNHVVLEGGAAGGDAGGVRGGSGEPGGGGGDIRAEGAGGRELRHRGGGDIHRGVLLRLGDAVLHRDAWGVHHEHQHTNDGASLGG